MRAASTRHLLFTAAAIALVIAAAAPSAQRRRAAEPNPVLPVATDVVAANPEAFYGKPLTLSAAVEEVLSKTAFTVDQRRVVDGTHIRSVGKPILVIAPTLSGPLDRKNYMLFVGELMKFDPAAVAQKAKDYSVDLTPDLIAKYQGRPVLVASAVLDTQYVDVTKRALTAEEQALSVVMRRVSAAYTALRRAADGTDPKLMADSAAGLKVAFTDTEPFWKQRPDALQWAREARSQTEAIERDATAAKTDALKPAVEKLGAVCQSCHTAYRDRLDDGTFRIKLGK